VFASGEIGEIAFGSPGSGIVWAGDSAGRLFRSTDDGERWRHVPSPLDDRFGVCDAIAVRPDRPDVVLAGLYAQGSFVVGEFVFRTANGGGAWVPVPTPPLDANGDRVGVRAVEWDPGEPEHAYAATDVGVFRSTDDGLTWLPFNEGMPNVRVTDLALATQTRVLRAGAWGRGVYERRLKAGDERDVRLHVRSTVLDDGTAQPTPGPDPLAGQPAGVRFDASPDIKVTRRDPRLGVLIDGAEFDDEVASVDVRRGPAFVSVQVHNRGAFSTTGVRVTVLWALADGGPPPIPPALWPALAGPIVEGTAFGDWFVLGDEDVGGPAGVGHDIVAPGYPRVIVFNDVLPFEWPAVVDTHRRVGIVAIVRSADDLLPAAPVGEVGVVDLVRTEAKIAYRECDVISTASDEQVVLRATDGAPFTIGAAGAAAQNGANGAAPLGLAVVGAPGTTEARFTVTGPFALPTLRRFTVTRQVTVTATLDVNEPAIGNLTRVHAGDVAAILNRLLIAAGGPVRAEQRNFVAGGERLRIASIGAARFTVGGTGAGTLGVTAAALTNLSETPFLPAGGRGPWNLSVGAARTLIVNVTTTVEVRLEPGVRELPPPPTIPAIDVRAGINRQLTEGGLGAIAAEPVVRRLTVRRSATESASGSRGTLGGLGLADLVVAPNPVLADADRRALFDVLSTHGADRLAGGAENHLYLRSANVGNVAEPAVRHRLFLADLTANPITFAELDPPLAITVPIAAGASVVTEFRRDVPAAASGSRMFAVAVADVDVAGFQVTLPADATALDALHEFCRTNPAVAVREFTIA